MEFKKGDLVIRKDNPDWVSIVSDCKEVGFDEYISFEANPTSMTCAEDFILADIETLEWNLKEIDKRLHILVHVTYRKKHMLVKKRRKIELSICKMSKEERGYKKDTGQRVLVIQG